MKVLALAVLTLATPLSASAFNAQKVVDCVSFDQAVRISVIRFVGSGMQMTAEANGTSYTSATVKRKKLASRYTYQSNDIGILEFHRGDNERSQGPNALYGMFTSYNENQASSGPMNCTSGQDVENSLRDDR